MLNLVIKNLFTMPSAFNVSFLGNFLGNVNFSSIVCKIDIYTDIKIFFIVVQMEDN